MGSSASLMNPEPRTENQELRTDLAPERPAVILITGIMAAGKSTVAQALAERLPRSVHVRGDLFRRMIVSGRAEMNFELSDEARQQLQLRYRIAASVAAMYLDHGFNVVYQDIIIGPDLAEVVRWYAQYPLYVVVLCPSASIAAERDAARSKTGYHHDAMADDFDRVLRTQTPRLGLWLDTSQLTPQETVEEILARLEEAEISRQSAGSSGQENARSPC